MKANKIKYLCIINVLLLNTFFSYAQSTQNLQVGITTNAANNRFCKGTPELFQLDARASGGTLPYSYEWTFSWRSDTLRDPIIYIPSVTTGDVKLKVTDKSILQKAKKSYIRFAKLLSMRILPSTPTIPARRLR